MRARLIRLATAAVAVLCTAAVLAGCRSEPPAEPATPNHATVPVSSPTADAREKQEAAKVLAAYDGYREAYITAAATSDFNDKVLSSYVADPLLTQLRATLRMQDQQGIVNQGRPSWTPRITALNVTTQPWTASVEDCFDATDWNAVYKATGKSAAAPGQAKRYLVSASAKFYDNGRWLIFESKADRSRPC